ncbi:MAG: hypothetical protein E5W25_22615, partial [Mesorhizobium sp.]
IYSAVDGALASGFATAELHNLWRRDPANRPWTHSLSGGAMGSDGWVRQLPDLVVSVLSRKL